MKIAVIGAGKWRLGMIGRIRSKAPHTTLTLSSLQQRAQAASCFVNNPGSII